MADFTINDLGTAVSRANSILWVQIPSPAPSGYDDLQIEPDIYLAPEQARLTANEVSIVSHGTRITTLENSLSKTYNAATGTFTIVQPANSLITLITFTVRTGTPNIKVGTTLAGQDIMYPQTGVASFYSEDVSKYSATSRTIYITITGGTCDVVTFRRLNLNS